MKSDARVLLLANTQQDAAMFRELLKTEYPDVRIQVDAKEFVAAFARERPDVLVMGMRSVADAERLYAEMFRDPQRSIAAPYKTLLLCGKDDVQRAYELCRSDIFDDYILFWPMAHDAPRLAMSIHHALRFLEAGRSAALLPQLRLQARRIAELEDALDAERSIGAAHARSSERSIEAISTSIRASLDTFGGRMVSTGLDESMVVSDIGRLLDELAQFDRLYVKPPVAAALEATTPVSQWIDALPARFEPHLVAAQSLANDAAAHRPLVLVIDDDEFMRKLLQQLLLTSAYACETASSAAQAIAFLRSRQPDLILMDVRLPDIDGIQLTRQLKAIDAYARIPIIMLTGQGNKQILIESKSVGAADFVVKPFDRETLLRKVATQLSIRTPTTQIG